MFAFCAAVLLGGFAVCAGEVAAANVFRRPIPRVASLDPLRSASVADAQAVALVYETPLEVDYAARPYRLASGLCELPEWSEDAKTCTLRVKEGHFFHPNEAMPHGREVTARDVAYSLCRLGDAANASSGAWIMRNVESVEAVDERVVKIVLKEPLHVFAWYLAMAYCAVVPKEAVEYFGERFGGVAAGSGAYTLASWRRNHEMVYRRAKDWPGWEDAPAPEGIVDEIRYYVIDDPLTQWLMFLKGELDLLPELSQDVREAVVDEMNAEKGRLQTSVFNIHVETPLVVFYMGMNLRDPVLGKNRLLRQALSCAFDFAAWREFRRGGVAEATGPVPPGVPGRVETPHPYAHDEEKALDLLEKAGYDVVRDAQSGRVQTIDPATGRRLALTYTLGRAAQQDREEAEFLKSFYDRVGIDLELKFMTWTGFLQAVDEGRVQLFRMGW
ncbi:MAG: hypothetical protein IJ802_01450, partial [Kiritimatiellae bacterium]|nr:hypothetical protein [Kiritimatiellia bacterium]